ncbi:hypothetical protein PIROE2DRAFT_59196 [Piromyces sp. E2]|nr:hypothetical protein PIROE2DRAFT_59196 [Piromyces sp. E2]|eukprot:OUM66764.1 hypothetical protein PIROE2DRAFT_59196 [Piromyces sp. E2]
MEYQPIENKIDIPEEGDNVSFDNDINRNTPDDINNNRNSVIDIHDGEDDETLFEDTDVSVKEKLFLSFFKQFLLKRVYITGFLAFLSLFALNIIYSLLFGQFLENTTNSNEENIDKITKLYPVVMIFYACIMGPMVEEFVFRKLLFGFIKKYSKILAYIVSCFLFAFAHFGFSFSILINEIWFFPDYFLAAVILAYTYDYDGYLLASMIAHMLYNSSMIVLGFLFEGQI